MWTGVGVILDVWHDVAACGIHSNVSGGRQPVVVGADQLALVAAGDGAGLLGRAVINDDDLVIGVGKVRQPCQRLSDGAGAVVAADDHRDLRPFRLTDRERNFSKAIRGGLECELWAAIARDEAKIPILDTVPAAVPLVGPGKDKGAGAAAFERSRNLPAQTFGLRAFAIAPAVEAKLGHHQRALARKILEPGKVGSECFPGLEV